jgi:hypothetical protein
MSDTGQNYSNHTRFDPAYHFLLIPVLLLNLIITIVFAVRHFTFTRGWLVVMALAFIIMTGLFRSYANKVQDRVIRLEERIRLSNVLPAALQSRIGELSTRQLVALRFASDAELSGLVARTLDEKLASKQIKQAIVSWRGDYERV